MNNFLFNAKQSNIIPLIKLKYFKQFRQNWEIAAKNHVAMATDQVVICLWVESLLPNINLILVYYSQYSFTADAYFAH